MKDYLGTYSAEERRLIARRASRDLNSEVRLILGGGFAVLMIVIFVLGEFTFLPIAERLNTSPTAVWIAMAFSLAAIWARIHYRVMKPKIEKAAALNAKFIDDYRKRR